MTVVSEDIRLSLFTGDILPSYFNSMSFDSHSTIFAETQLRTYSLQLY